MKGVRILVRKYKLRWLDRVIIYCVARAQVLCFECRFCSWMSNIHELSSQWDGVGSDHSLTHSLDSD